MEYIIPTKQEVDCLFKRIKEYIPTTMPFIAIFPTQSGLNVGMVMLANGNALLLAQLLESAVHEIIHVAEKEELPKGLELQGGNIEWPAAS